MVKSSVVVPVYKTEQYLDQCVRSLLNQSYPELEIILVNDGSPDNCGIMCDRYASEDARVKVIHKENGGLSSCREAGLTTATGDYLTFVDSDDWVDPDLLLRCAQVIAEHSPDCILYSYIKEYPTASIPVHLYDGGFHYSPELAEEHVHRRIVGLMGEELAHPERVDALSSTCMKMYRTEVARRGKIVSERVVGPSEDTIFNLYALEDCSVSYIDRCLYHYRKTNAVSITSQYKADLVEKWDMMHLYFQKYVGGSVNPKRYREAYLNRTACSLIGLGLNEIAADASMIAKACRIRSVLNREPYRSAVDQLDITRCPLKWKVFFLLCKFHMAFLLTVLLSIINRLRSRVSA